MPHIYKRVVKWCAQECARQQSGELSVLWMFNAWSHAIEAHDQGLKPDTGHILMLGRLVEPEKNANGFRVVPVRVPGPKQPPTASTVPGAIERLVYFLSEGVDPATFYKEFEEIHPFVDGNGRVGVHCLYRMIHLTFGGVKQNACQS